MRDEIDQRPDAQDAEQPLEGAGEKGQQQHGLDVLRAAQRRQGATELNSSTEIAAVGPLTR